MSKTTGLPAEQNSVATFHREAADWRKQNALWLDELAVWEQEHQKGLGQLAKLEETLHHFAETAAEQRVALSAEQQLLADHEHGLAGYLQGDESQKLAALETQHRTARDQQIARRQQQDRAKRLFGEMMKRLEAVERALKG